LQSFNTKYVDLSEIAVLLDSNLSSEIRKMHVERAKWMRAITDNSATEQIKDWAGESSRAAKMAIQIKNLQIHPLAEKINWHMLEGSPAVQMAKQWQEATQNSIRRMLDPLREIREGFLVGSVTKRMLDDFVNPAAASQQMAKLMDQATASSALMKAMHSSIEDSMESARKMLEHASVGSRIGQLTKSFEETNKHWVVPQPLLDSLGPLQALQEKIGRLSFPVIDTASAATLASLLGSEGILAQLAAMGINPDGSMDVHFVQQDEGIGINRKTLELMALLSFILTLLIPIYQEISSSRWQDGTDKTLAAHTLKIESLTKLVERALVQEAKRQEERFVVLDRVVEIRSIPEHGSAFEGKLLPREVVRPVSESGKWIQIEYYHWLHKEYRTGWALKKYFQRVPTNFERPHQTNVKAQ
jgi:hypothetical protein